MTFPDGFNVREVSTTGHTMIETFGNLFLKSLQEKSGGRLTFTQITRFNHVMNGFLGERFRLWVVFDSTLDIPVSICALSMTGELEAAYVVPSYRGRGLHRAMIRLRKECGGWFSTVNPSNVRSAQNLSKEGFEKVASFDAT